jgi:hypothetical protein
MDEIGCIGGNMNKELLIFGLLMATMTAATIPASDFTRYTQTQIREAINMTFLNVYYDGGWSNPQIYTVYKINRFALSNQYNGEAFGATGTPTIVRFSLKFSDILSCLSATTAISCYSQMFNGTTAITITGTPINPIRMQREAFLNSEIRRSIAIQQTLANETIQNNLIGLNWLKTMLSRERT